MSVFYSYSNNGKFSRELYELISSDEALEIIDVDTTNENESELTNKILSHVSDAVFMVCDITPDLILDCVTKSVKTESSDPLKLVGLPNPNVMLELGCFMRRNLTSDIILLCDENQTKRNSNLIPSMLRGYEITYYNSTANKEDTVEAIKEKIQIFIKNFDKQIEDQITWKNFDYDLTKDFLETITGLVDIKIRSYSLRINKNLHKAVMMFFGQNSSKRKINIFSKKLYLTNKEICLSKFKNIYEELKHIELLINLNFNN